VIGSAPRARRLMRRASAAHDDLVFAVVVTLWFANSRYSSGSSRSHVLVGAKRCALLGMDRRQDFAFGSSLRIRHERTNDHDGAAIARQRREDAKTFCEMPNEGKIKRIAHVFRPCVQSRYRVFCQLLNSQL